MTMAAATLALPVGSFCQATRSCGSWGPSQSLTLRRKIGKLGSYHLPFWSGVALEGEDHECQECCLQPRSPPFLPHVAPPSITLSCEMSGHDHHSPLAMLSSGLQRWSDQVSGWAPHLRGCQLLRKEENGCGWAQHPLPSFVEGIS